MPRVVLDTNVLISGLISPSGPNARILGALRTGSFELVTSPQLLAELRGVPGRKKFRRYVTTEEVDEFVEVIERESEVVDDPPAGTPAVSEDPRDEYLIALARAARVDALVSGDIHLTRLRGTLPVRTPREFADELP